MSRASSFIVSPGGKLAGEVRVPGDKSISHRSIIFAAIADGVTSIRGFLQGEDCLATINAFRAMGVPIEGPVNGPEGGNVTVHGVGIDGLQAPDGPMDMGNSGTSMRLMTGLLAGQEFDSELVGDGSLMTRPMHRVTDPLQIMGAIISTTDSGTAPIRISGGGKLRGLDYELPLASAQVKSAVLLAGLYAEGQTCVTEPAPTRDHTERMLSGFAYKVDNPAYNKVCIEGGGRLTATQIDVPADISSATFFMLGASIAPGSDITLKHVGTNPTRTGVIDILRLMGADISIGNESEVGGEPVADIRVRYTPLKGIVIPEELVPLAIDEFPAIFVAAACAEGETILTGAEELRVKESDRIAVMADGLKVLGVKAKPTADGIVIAGGDGFKAGEIQSCGDHRIAMAFAMAALRARGSVTIRDCANVNTSFPGFASLAADSGLNIQAD